MVTVLSTAQGVTVTAQSRDPASAALPKLTDLFQTENVYLTKYRDNYYLDMAEIKGFDAIRHPIMAMNASINVLANVGFATQQVMTWLLIVIIYYSFELDIYQLFSSLVGAIIGEMKIALFDELSLIAIVLLGLYYCVKIISDQKTQIWVAIIQTVVVVALAMTFFTQNVQLLRGMDNVSKEISRSVLTGTYKASNQGQTPETAVVAVINDIWVMFVHNPWQVMQFGDLDLAKREEDRILSLPPGSAARQEIIEELAESEGIFTAAWGPKRLGFMIIYMIPMFIMYVIKLILALLILGYQFLTMGYFTAGIIIFIQALIPFFGIKIIWGWLAKVISSGFIRVIVCFIMALIFAFNAGLFKLTKELGWFGVLILQLLVAALIVWKRQSFFEMITNSRMALRTGSVGKPFRRDTNLEHEAYQRSDGLASAAKQGSLRALTKLGVVKGEEKSDVQEDKQSRSSSSSYSGKTSGGGSTGSHSRDSAETVSYRSKSSEGFEGDLSSIEKEQLSQELSGMNESMRTLTKKAEELLERKFEDEKQEAEEKAERLGKEPEYSSFVKKVQTRENLGAERFDTREIAMVANALKRVIGAGGTPEDLYQGTMKQETPEKMQRPESLESVENTLRVQIGNEQVDLDKNEAYRVADHTAALGFKEEFNTKYNKQYDSAFFKQLVERYGQENVRFMLDRMQQVEKQGNMIQNPAGYLTTGLKNNERDHVRLMVNRESAAAREMNIERVTAPTGERERQREPKSTPMMTSRETIGLGDENERLEMQQDIEKLEKAYEKEQKVTNKLEKVEGNLEQQTSRMEEIVNQGNSRNSRSETNSRNDRNSNRERNKEKEPEKMRRKEETIK